MALRRFSTRLSLAFGLIFACGMAATNLLLGRIWRVNLLEEMTENLYSQADLIEAKLSGGPSEDARRLSKACASRFTLIGRDGAVLGDSALSDEQVRSAPNHKYRPEVSEALGGRRGSSIRYSETLRGEMLYAAVPSATGVVRTALPLGKVRGKIGGMRKVITAATCVMLLAVLLAAWGLSRSISRPVQDLSRAAQRLANGDYGVRIRRLPPDEHGLLGENLNLLAEKIQESIREISREKGQLSAILLNMIEAVVAVDDSGRILAVNPAFCSMFAWVEVEQARGRGFLEVLRHSRLDALLRTVLKEKRAVSDEIRVFASEERIFEAHAAPLGTGALLVLHDITRLRKLEQVRKDFVANVSHELRTPLASIQAFAETLRRGGIDDSAHRMEFVEAIENGARRMARLIDDLLELSAIESGKRPPKLEALSLPEVAGDAARPLMHSARQRGISIDLAFPASLPLVRADRLQLLQVLTNLIDNAVKFNKDRGSVRVSAEGSPGRVFVSVADTGCGIPAEDLPRIFERFYRVDKARSRELGGTGLGLAIVKHIVEAHGGTVAVESPPGKGSIFRFTLPSVPA
jgi:two-component system phosphate regulon sensor histidine kinase PhoR